jgi:hypothetical protein
MEAPPRPGRFPVSDGFKPKLLRYGSMRISNPRKKESPKKGAGRGKTEPKIENFRKQSRKQAGSKRKQAIVPNSPSGFQKEKLITVGRYGSKECEKRLI